MSATDFKGYTEQAKRTDRDLWLGELLWYTVFETRVKHTDLEAALVAAGLKQFVPRKPRDEDVFRREAPNGHKRKVATAVPDVHVNYRIHQVKRGGGVCVKHIVAETVDSAGERLSFEPVYELKYIEGSGGDDLSVQSLVSPTDTVAEAIADDIVSNYRANRGWVNSNAIRSIICHVMEACKATNVRPTGGVFFVMSTFADTVASLEKFSATVPGCQVHALPLISDEKQREMVKRAYEAESVGEIESMLAEIAQILAAPDATLSTRRYAAYAAKFTSAMSKTKDYEGLLQDTLDETNTKLDILRKQMSQLLLRASD